MTRRSIDENSIQTFRFGCHPAFARVENPGKRTDNVPWFWVEPFSTKPAHVGISAWAGYNTFCLPSTSWE